MGENEDRGDFVIKIEGLALLHVAGGVCLSVFGGV